jgi:tetratricopeptide (TPR) repeat protein
MIAAGSGIWGWSWFQRREKRRQAEIAHEEGRTLMRQRNQKSAGEAIPRLIRAIDLDPSYGLAYATLSQAISRQGRPSVPLANGQPLTALGAAQRGVEVDPNCGQCQGSFGFFLFFHNWRWSEADDHLRRAVELEPQTASIRPSYAMLLSVTGRGEEALRQVDEAVRRVPYQAGYHTVRAGVLYLLRRYEESVAAADHAISLSPLERQAWEWRSRAMFLLGRPEEGLKSMAENIFAAHALDLERAWKDGGAEGGLRKLLAITSDWRSAEIQSWRRAGWKTLLGDTEGALDELETAFRIRSTNLLYIGLDPGYDRLRSHPRFQRILDGLGLAAELQRHRR